VFLFAPYPPKLPPVVYVYYQDAGKNEEGVSAAFNIVTVFTSKYT
jgi:hypothetical protein